MIININYSEQIAHAKTQGASQVDFKRNALTQLKNSPNQARAWCARKNVKEAAWAIR